MLDPSALDAATVAEWDDLARDAAQPNPFFAPWFLRPALARLDPGGTVRLLTLRNEDGDLTGLMPVVPAATHARVPVRNLSVWKSPHLYIGTPLLRRGRERGAMRSLVSWIGTGGAGIGFLRLTQLCVGGAVHRALVEMCDASDCTLVPRRRHARAVLHRGHDVETLLRDGYSTKRRAELRRRFRRFDEGGCVALAERRLSPAEAPTVADAFMRLERMGWKGTDPDGVALARTPAEHAFFHDVLARASRGGHALATVLSRNDAPVAIGITLRHGDALFGFKTAFDRAHARSSPGIRLFHETTRAMLADPAVALYDSCAMPDHPVIDAVWPDRRETLEIDIVAPGTVNAGATRLAAKVAAVKDRLTGH